MKAHCRLRFSLAAAAEECLVANLWSAGTTGLEVQEAGDDRLEIDAYFPSPAPIPGAALEPGGSYWGTSECELIEVETIEEKDWLASYRETAAPRPVGRRLSVDPGEPGRTQSRGPKRDGVSGRVLLRLPARTAFGTGSHESTRLTIELLERQELGGLRVLDVGCGTGILSFAALLEGARSVVAVEIDAGAAFVAHQNQRLNDMFFGIVAGSPSCLGRRPRFDLALVNVVPENIRPELPVLGQLLRNGGRAVFSGFLGEQAAAVMSRLGEHGFAPLDEAREGEWMAVLVERRGAM